LDRITVLRETVFVQKLAMFILVIGSLILPTTLVMARPVQQGDIVVVIVPPWKNADSVIEHAGGQLVGPWRAAFGQFALSPDPDFIPSLRQSGAWAVLNGNALAYLCGVSDV
jgi:hypothetical protein